MCDLPVDHSLISCMGPALHRWACYLERQTNDERGAFAQLRFNTYGAPVFLRDNPMGYGQSLSGTSAHFLGRKEGLKDAIPDILPNPGPRIANPDHHIFSILSRGD